MNLRKKGFEIENIVVEYLERKKFTILKKNYYSIYGEIDIIAEKENCITFIEVKGNTLKNNYISPTFKINKKKQKSLYITAYDYLEKSNIFDKDIQFNLIIVSEGKITCYNNIITSEMTL